MSEAVTEQQEGVVYCPAHPKEETSLRCNKCGRPMCTKCAVQTPVGYRCKDCVKGQQKIFYNAEPADMVIQAIVAFFLNFIVGGIVQAIGGGFFFLIIIFMVGSAVGGGIGDIARRVVDGRRGKYNYLAVAAAMIAGAFAPVALAFVGLLPLPPIPRLGLLLYAGVSVAGAVGRLKLNQLRIN